MSCKIVSLQCSWIRSLYKNYFHKWKLIPLHLIIMSFGSKSKFHSNTFLKKHHLEKLLLFYRDIFINWKTHFSSRLETPACLYSQFFWFNKYIQIEDNFVCLQLKILIFDLNFLKGVVWNLGMTLKLNKI